MEAPRPQFFKQQDTQKESIFRRNQEKEWNTGRARRKNRGQGGEEHNATTRDRKGNEPPVEASRGGGGAGVRMVKSGREKKGPLDGRTLGPTGT